jgi:hypothetical protein
MSVFGRYLRLGDQLHLGVGELLGGDGPAIPALQPGILIGRQQDQPVPAVLGDSQRLAERPVGERAVNA